MWVVFLVYFFIFEENTIMTSTQELHRVLPPSTRVRYASAEAAEAALHAWMKTRGIVVTRAKLTTNDDGVLVQRVFECECSGRPKNTWKLDDTTRKRPPRASKKIGCPMRIKICAVDSDKPRGPWQIAYTKYGSMLHNHPPDKSKRGRRQMALASASDASTEPSTSSELPGRHSSEVSTGDDGSPLGTEPLAENEDGVSSVHPGDATVSSRAAYHASREAVTPVPVQPALCQPVEQSTSGTRPMEGTLYAWPRRRPPHALVMDVRERIFHLFGAQPIPLHVVESVAMKEMIYALQPSMVPYGPTLHETHEAITRRRYDSLGPVRHHNIQR